MQLLRSKTRDKIENDTRKNKKIRISVRDAHYAQAHWLLLVKAERLFSTIAYIFRTSSEVVNYVERKRKENATFSAHRHMTEFAAFQSECV